MGYEPHEFAPGSLKPLSWPLNIHDAWRGAESIIILMGKPEAQWGLALACPALWNVSHWERLVDETIKTQHTTSDNSDRAQCIPGSFGALSPWLLVFRRNDIPHRSVFLLPYAVEQQHGFFRPRDCNRRTFPTEAL